MEILVLKYVPVVPVLFVLGFGILNLGVDPDVLPSEGRAWDDIPQVERSYVYGYDINLGAIEQGWLPPFVGEEGGSLVNNLIPGSRPAVGLTTSSPLYLNLGTLPRVSIDNQVMGQVVPYGNMRLQVPTQGFGNERMLVQSSQSLRAVPFPFIGISH